MGRLTVVDMFDIFDIPFADITVKISAKHNTDQVCVSGSYTVCCSDARLTAKHIIHTFNVPFADVTVELVCPVEYCASQSVGKACQQKKA